MSKKHLPKTDKNRFSDLTNVNETASEITGKSKSKTFGLKDTKEPTPTPLHLTKKNRAKFTTMLRPDLREKLQNIADNNAISIADTLETIIEEYLDLK